MNKPTELAPWARKVIDNSLGVLFVGFLGRGLFHLPLLGWLRLLFLDELLVPGRHGEVAIVQAEQQTIVRGEEEPIGKVITDQHGIVAHIEAGQLSASSPIQDQQLSSAVRSIDVFAVGAEE